ncbi:MAG: DUF2523 family protein [Cypionkella sp.]
MGLPVIGFVAGLIGRLIPALSRLVGTKFGPWIAMVLVYFGLNIMVAGVGLLPFISDARAAWGGLPSELAEWLGVLRVDQYVTAILSAHAISASKEAGRASLLMAGRR